MADKTSMHTDSRIDWIEPEVRSLAIAETSSLPGRSGADGETIWTDCTLS